MENVIRDWEGFRYDDGEDIRLIVDCRSSRSWNAIRYGLHSFKKKSETPIYKLTIAAVWEDSEAMRVKAKHLLRRLFKDMHIFQLVIVDSQLVNFKNDIIGR